MNELDLKEIIFYLHTRIRALEGALELKDPFIDRSDKYINEILDSIKEGE